jgi:putative NIF3 family GTP cyclohydrolase 1 type 2
MYEEYVRCRLAVFRKNEGQMTPTSKIIELLDKEFRVEEVGDPGLVKHALSDVGRSKVTEAFLNEKSGLMFDFAQAVDKVYCVVFTTTEVFDRLLSVANGPSLIFTHHPHDYHEDTRGIGPFPEDYLEEFEEREISVYTIHAPLDVGLNICVSKSFADRLCLSNIKPFYEANGGYLGVMGTLNANDIDATAQYVSRSLGIDTVDVFDNDAEEGFTAVVAGAGDQPEILKKAKELGCTTYITGTAVHRWAFDPIQKLNKEFHTIAKELRINLIGASHYHTEKCAVQDITTFLQENVCQAAFLEDPVLERYSIGNWPISA